MAIWSRRGKRLNVELKAGGISPQASSTIRIGKDIEKLLVDPGDGLWVHLLEPVDNGTLGKIASTIAKAARAVAKKRRPAIAGKRIGFHFRVLRHGFSIHKIVPASRLVEDPSGELGFGYRVSRSSLQGADDRNGWCLRP